MCAFAFYSASTDSLLVHSNELLDKRHDGTPRKPSQEAASCSSFSKAVDCITGRLHFKGRVHFLAPQGGLAQRVQSNAGIRRGWVGYVCQWSVHHTRRSPQLFNLGDKTFISVTGDKQGMQMTT